MFGFLAWAVVAPCLSRVAGVIWIGLCSGASFLVYIARGSQAVRGVCRRNISVDLNRGFCVHMLQIHPSTILQIPITITIPNPTFHPTLYPTPRFYPSEKAAI